MAMLDDLPSPLLSTDPHAILVRKPRSNPVTASSPAGGPTTSVFRMLCTAAIAGTLALLVGAPGVVHVARGMQDGPERTAFLDIGQRVQPVSDRLHLTWPWYRLQAALGHSDQPSTPPLLASAPTATPTSHPRRPRRTHRTMTSRRPTPTVQPLRTITKRNPLHILITGDSLPGYIGPFLLNDLIHIGPVTGWTDVHDGTGLTRPDFVDWSVVARQQVAQRRPDAVVVMIGGNDFQNMVAGRGRVLIAGTPAWRQEYQRRATICMRVWAQGTGHRVYWLSVPPARDPGWAYDDAQINIALRAAAARVPGAHYLDVLGPITNRGRYVEAVSVSGRLTLVREPDGVHLNIAGSEIVANEVAPAVAREWHLSYRTRHPKRHAAGSS